MFVFWGCMICEHTLNKTQQNISHKPPTPTMAGASMYSSSDSCSMSAQSRVSLGSGKKIYIHRESQLGRWLLLFYFKCEESAMTIESQYQWYPGEQGAELSKGKVVKHDPITSRDRAHSNPGSNHSPFPSSSRSACKKYYKYNVLQSTTVRAAHQNI